MIAEPLSTASRDALLAEHLAALLGDVAPASMDLLRRRLTWVEIAAGDTLMSQGDPGDSMYLSISGRLRAYVRDEDGAEHMVREMSRGQVIGEMSLYTDEPRSATVVAIRNSVLVRLEKSEFGALLASGAQVSIALTRQLIRRLQTPQARAPLARPVAIGVVPICSGVQALAFGQRLAEQLRRLGRVCVVDATAIDEAFQEPGLAQRDAADTESQHRIARYLDDVEADHDFVLLVADGHASEWTRRCTRHCDEMLLLADTSQSPALHDTELEYLARRPGRAEAAETLVLMHEPQVRCPTGTREWLARRPVTGHVHIRPTLERDMARLARLLSRTAVGLVLAGGGARGCAHLGLYRALQERGIEIDCVGGTSIGSVMAALVASDRPLDEVMAVARRAFSVNPTGDYNLVPLLSLIKGRRLRRILGSALDELFGGTPDVEDLWKTYFCIASNFSQSREQRVVQGSLFQAMLASIAIPGALPPVLHEGDLLCDGGTFNNFPVDVMHEMRGVGQVIGVDLRLRKPRRIDHDDVPGSWALLRDRLRPRKQRRYKFPSLVAYLMNVTVLYSSSRQRQSERLTDLYFNPPLERVGMLQWEKFDSIVAQGHAHGAEVLNALAPDRLRRFAPSAA
ncbi:putative NTE family protein [Burkholderiaceae bacterium]|nr:putative NTE family protein [Burkholderiaceae bacterium]